jgi:hypothetical protein
MGAPLRRQHNAADLLHLRIVWWTNSVKVAGNLKKIVTRKYKKRYLRAQIRDNDELLKDILRQDVRVSRVLDVVRVNVDVLRAQMQIRRADRAHAPFRARRKRLTL